MISATRDGLESPVRNSALRASFWLLLCCFEMLAISVVHRLPVDTPHVANPFFYFKSLGLWGIVSVVVFAILSWHDRRQLFEIWQQAQAGHRWRRALFVNLASFAVLLSATALLARSADQPFAAIAPVLAIYSALVLFTVFTLMRVDVPLRSIAAIAWQHPLRILAAAAAGLMIRLASFGTQYAWWSLSKPTLDLSHFFLSLFESDISVDLDEPSIRVGHFQAVIADNCSGYEGIGLVVAFLSVYLWVFRAHLRFPHVLWLFPIGIVTVWVLNSVRIALLILIGAHVSPHVAVQGFHSRAGWVGFLIVAVVLMVLCHSMRLFNKTVVRAERRAAAETDAAPFLVPFMALMLASLVMEAASPREQPLYVLKVLLGGAAILVYWGRDWTLPSISPVAWLAGLATGLCWIATDPHAAGSTALGSWLAQQGQLAIVFWLVMRGLGTIVVVPIAEELAFRGFLYRWIIDRRFQAVPYYCVSVVALLVSSALFGVLHERWLAAFLAGALFACVMIVTRRISDAIVAHGLANAVIFAWALTFEQWSLL